MDKKIVVSLGVDTSGVSKGMAKAQQTVNQGTNGIASGFKKATSGIGSFLGVVGKIAGAIGILSLVRFGVNAIQNGVRALTVEMNNNKKAWSSFEGNMKILGKTDKEIQRVKGSLQDYAVQTIYNASDMASTYAQLEAVGTESTESLVKGMAGLAASSENPKQAMKSLSQQMTQAAGRPKIAWEDFKIMLEQAPAGMAAVAEHMGMSMDELVAAIQAGEVSTDDFLAAVTEVGNRDEFQQMATEFRTVDDAIEGLTESLAVKLGPTFDILSGVAIDAIGAITEAIEGLDWEAFNNGLEKAIEWVTNLFNTIRESTAFQTFGEAIGIIVEDLQEFWVKIQEGDSLLSPLVEDLEDLGQALLDIDFTEIVNDLSRLIEIVGPFIRILGPLVGYIGVAVGVFRLLSSVVTKVTTVFKALKLAFGFVKLITDFKDAITLVGMAIPLLTNPIFWVAAAIAALIAIGVLLWKNWDTIKEKASELGEMIGNVWNSIKEAVSEAWEGIKTYLAEMWEGIVQWGADLWESALEIGSNFVENLMTFFQELPYNIGFAIGVALATIVKWGIDLWNKAKEIGSNFVTNLITFFQELPGKISTWLTNTIAKVTAWVTNMIAKAKEAGANFVNNVVNFIQNLPGRIQTWLTNTIARVITWASDLVSKGRQAASDLVNAVVNGVKSLPSKMASMGRQLVQGFWNGIQALKGWITGKVTSFFSGIVDGAKSVFGIKSPSRVFMSIGGFIVEGFMDGIDNLSDKATKQMKGFAKGIISEADGIAPGVNSSLNALDPDVSFKGNTSLNAQLDKLKDRDYTPIVHVHVSDGDIILDGEKVGKQLAPTVKKENDRVKGMRDRSKGINSNFGGVFG